MNGGRPSGGTGLCSAPRPECSRCQLVSPPHPSYGVVSGGSWVRTLCMITPTDSASLVRHIPPHRNKLIGPCRCQTVGAQPAIQRLEKPERPESFQMFEIRSRPKCPQAHDLFQFKTGSETVPNSRQAVIVNFEVDTFDYRLARSPEPVDCQPGVSF
jgi:hypothetical protein